MSSIDTIVDNDCSEFPEFSDILGVRTVAGCAGLRYENQLDLAVFEFAPGTAMGATFTQNKFCAAPVKIAKKNLLARDAKLVSFWIINTGFANAGTGQAGLNDAEDTCKALATYFSIPSSQVVPFSTGIIGEPLPLQKIQSAMPGLVGNLGQNEWLKMGTAIMTTDTRPKGVFKQGFWGGQSFNMGGISKGAGMIKPNMATMLGFIVTDLSIAPELMQSMLEQAVAKSFNAISVDGDTSTNDACIFAATGQALCIGLGVDSQESAPDFYQYVQQLLNDICLSLALAIIRDAEGATKCVKIHVQGAKNVEQARIVAESIAHSPLVKTAFFAEDPNWGRILAAIGRAPIQNLAVDWVDIGLDDVKIVQQGAVAKDYQENLAATVMQKKEFTVWVDLHAGDAEFSLWTTDLSYDYIKINADYRS